MIKHIYIAAILVIVIVAESPVSGVDISDGLSVPNIISAVFHYGFILAICAMAAWSVRKDK